MKKIEAALTTVKSVRQELSAATRGVSKAAKTVALLEAKLVAAQQELDTAALRAEDVLKKAHATTKALDVSKVKKVPAVKPAPKKVAAIAKTVGKALIKKADKKPTRAEQRAAAKAPVKAPVKAAAKPAAKPAVKKAASKPVAKPAAKKAVKAPAAK